MMEMIYTIIGWLYMAYFIWSSLKESRIYKLIIVTAVLDILSQSYGFESVVLSLGSVTLYASDMVTMLMIAYLLKRGTIKKNCVNAVYGLLFVQILLSICFGIISFGICTEVLNDIRVFIRMIIPIIYFLNNPVAIDDSTKRFALNILTLFIFYCYFALVLKIAFGITLAVSNDGQGGGLRVIGSDGACLLALVDLYFIYEYIHGNKQRMAKIVLITPLVVVLQHNSVWIAFLGGMLVLLLGPLNRRMIKYNKFKLMLCSMLAIIISLAIMVGTEIGDIVLNSIASTFDKFSMINNSVGTIGNRQFVWGKLLGSLDGIEWLFGKKMGSGWFYPPHSGYVQAVMRVGIWGTMLLFGVLLFASMKSFIKRKYEVCSLIVATMLYMITYMFSFEISCIWGGCISAAFNKFMNDRIYQGEENENRISFRHAR